MMTLLALPYFTIGPWPVVFYHPDFIIKEPLILLDITNGFSSYGRLIGGIIVFFIWTRGPYKKNRLLSAEAAAWSLPFAWNRHPRRPGFYLALIPILYAPARFALDFLRISGAEGGDTRYFGLTPAQYLSFILTGIGVYVFRQHRSYRKAL